MPLVERLRKRAKELDAKVKLSLTSGLYDFQSGDDRDMLEAAIRAIEGADRRLADTFQRMYVREGARGPF